MVIVDLGCGDGRWVLKSAAEHPEREYIGIDLVGVPLERAAKKAPRNATFLRTDAVEWLAKRGRGSIDEVHIYHPQPYYDPTVVGFGMLTAAFFSRLWLAMKRGGMLVLQTDNKRLGKYLLAAADLHFEVAVQPGPWPDAPEGRTWREALSIRRKLTILRAVGRRRAKPLDTAPPPPYFIPGTPGLRRVREKNDRHFFPDGAKI